MKSNNTQKMTHIATFVKKISPLALIMITLGCGYLSAQDTNEGDTPSIITILEANKHTIPNTETRTQAQASATDVAYIHQIGNENIGAIRVNAAKSELNLVQQGNANQADIKLSGKSLLHNTLQNGNGNLLLEYGNTPNLNLERDIIQNGNNQNIVIYGSNSLTQSLKLNVQGNAESITIRNFN